MPGGIKVSDLDAPPIRFSCPTITDVVQLTYCLNISRMHTHQTARHLNDRALSKRRRCVDLIVCNTHSPHSINSIDFYEDCRCTVAGHRPCAGLYESVHCQLTLWAVLMIQKNSCPFIDLSIWMSFILLYAYGSCLSCASLMGALVFNHKKRQALRQCMRGNKLVS